MAGGRRDRGLYDGRNVSGASVRVRLRLRVRLKRCMLPDFNATVERTMTFLFLDVFYYFIFLLYINI